MSSIMISSTPEAVFGAIENIMAGLDGLEMPEEFFYDVKLILSELFVNAMIHGNGQDPARKIAVDYLFCGEKLKLTITDEGEGFDHGRIYDPLAVGNVMKLSGRGLFLVKNLADRVEFNEKGNSVTVEKTLGQRI
ncbi:MAG: hypothetical protein A2008_05520 [Candidatus Wallbacteria bacterium GWC2_49_35]|uniref:Histidine kinase/HSP90-like ATPase domain-containing protein n=1 Tax=Candidatus Wallbacteria bacterium GWC2_49_35 TaxID=1817813 RepID=A0A1F7WQ60_9BACT|nr:MAG: hypothetical protein A2008_05520 [Candidatus Wallbacteria bacterium GWC2_49_35]HBC73953.1 hypothetical protein [Candidatus Wallbacteria bacterium]